MKKFNFKQTMTSTCAAFKKGANFVWSKIKAFTLNRNAAAWFFFLMIATTVSFFVYVLVRGTETFMSPYFRGGKDMFMDYFNSVRDVSLGEGVYTVRHVIYPPMANLIFLVFLRLMPKGYVATQFADRQTWVNYPASMFSVLLFLVVPMVILALLCAANFKGAPTYKKAFGLFSIINYPVLYMVERGNILIYTVLATAVFVFYYDSESKVKREIALIALAFAFSLKIYPAILGAVLLVDKRYKDAIRCAIYALVLLILPSFFFGGPVCLKWMLDNIRSFSGNRSETSGNIWFWCSFAVYLLAVFVQKDKTKLLIFGVAVLRVFPALASMYAWSFFLPVLCLFIGEQTKMNVKNAAYFFLMVFPFVFAVGLGKEDYARGADMLLHILLSLCILDTAWETYRAISNKRKGKKTMVAEGEGDVQPEPVAEVAE